MTKKFVCIAERDGESFQEFGAENYNQTIEQMSEEAWQKKFRRAAKNLCRLSLQKITAS